MSAAQLSLLIRGLRQLRRPSDLVALRAATSPQELSRLAMVPAARNLGIAAVFLPADLRSEGAAALLACRVLDAYEDLIERSSAADAVRNALAYLVGVVDTPPAPPLAVAVRDSEAVDLVLAERIHDVRALVSALPVESRQRINLMLADVAAVMARNLDAPLPRAVYGRGVLGRVVLYACSLVVGNTCKETDLSEFAGCLGTIAQLANDLRDREFALYGVGDPAELTQAVMVRLLAPALGGFALLDGLGSSIPSRGARTAVAYMAITTTAFLCGSVRTRAPYSRRLQLAAAMLAARSPAHWAAMMNRIRRRVDGAIGKVLEDSPALFAETELPASNDVSPRLAPLIVGATFDLVDCLPEEPLTGEMPVEQVRRMMFADHLAFGAIEWLRPRDAVGLADLADQFKQAAMGTAVRGAHR